MPDAPKLVFADKYDAVHAHRYFVKHRTGWRRRMTTWRETWLLRRALKLAGDPDSVLDMPCGAGRFLPMLASTPARHLFAADNSAAMMRTAQSYLDPTLRERIRFCRMTAFDLPLADGAVDHVVCMRLLHHIADSEHRLRILGEIHRVARSGATFSLWVDGNLHARRRQARAAASSTGTLNRLVIPRERIEVELARSGFFIRARLDVLKGISAWRLNVVDRV